MADHRSAAPAPSGYYPPTGTYPSPAEAPAVSSLPPPQPEPPKKSRRVGVYTMALCLIAAGVVLVLSVFLPNLDYIFIARMFPVVLVLLGIELLISAVRHRQDKMRIDFLTIFICLILIGGSTVAAVIPQIFQQEVQGSQISHRLEAELGQTAYQTLQQDGTLDVYELDWYVSVGAYGADFQPNMSVADIRSEQDIQFRMGLLGDYADTEAFAADCRAALRLLRPLVPHLDYVSFHSVSPQSLSADGELPIGSIRYNLWLSGPYQIEDDSLPLKEYVSATRINEDGYEELLSDLSELT